MAMALQKRRHTPPGSPKYAISHCIQALRVVLLLLVAAGLGTTWVRLFTAPHSALDRSGSSAHTQAPPIRLESRHVASLRRPLWWFAPFFDHSSFGQEASTYMLSLKRDAGVNASQLWTGMMSNGCGYELGDAMAPEDRHDLEAMRRPSHPPPQESAVVVCHNLAWYMTFEGQGHGCQPCPPPGYNAALKVVRAMAEADLVLGYTIQFLNKADEVWVPTQFSAKAMRNSGLHVPIRVLPQSFNTTFFSPDAHPPAVLPMGTLAAGSPLPRPPGKRGKRPFVFISVFKWEARKGWDVLLQAYLREFANSPDVELYIVTHAFGRNADIVQEVKDHARKWFPNTDPSTLPAVYIISQFVTSTDLARLYRASDAFVLPTRGEGWGRPASEAMSMGLPAIVTAWSGPAEFVTQATGYPLQYTLTPAERNDFNNPRAKWAQPSVRHLQQLMRRASSKRKEARRKGRAARALMVEHYSLGAVARQLQELLQQAEADLAARRARQST